MESDNNENRQNDPSRHHRSHGHSSSHHSHSHQQGTSSSRPKRSGSHRKSLTRHRLEDLPRLKSNRRVESFFTKNILTFFGIIFMIGALWFGFSTWKASNNNSLPEAGQVSVVKDSFTKSFSITSSIFESAPLLPTSKTPDSWDVLLILFFLGFILTALVISIRKKNILLRVFSFLSWICLASWILVRLVLTSDILFFYSFIVLSTLIYLLFFLSGFVDSFIIRNRWKFRLEYFLILSNTLLYLCTIFYLLHRFSFKNFEVVFVLFLSAINLIAIYYADKRKFTINKIPYLLSTLIVTCFILPLTLRINPLIIYFSQLSIFLVLFSKYSKNRVSIFFSYISMLILLVFWFYQWVFIYLKKLFLNNSVIDSHLFYFGLIAGLFLWLTFATNNSLLARINRSSAAPRWLRKPFYRKMIKGIYLIIIYFSSFWVFYYIFNGLLKMDGIKLLILFSFNCLYFIFIIPILSRQNSSFLRLVIIFSILSTFIYPVFVHLHVIELRDSCIGAKNISAIPFLFHYINIALLVILFYVLFHYFKRAFARKKALIKIFWLFLFTMMVFLLITEYVHISTIYAVKHNLNLDEVNLASTRIPFSLIFIFSSFVALIFGFVLKTRFLRIFSTIMLSGVLIKVLAYDIFYLSSFQKTVFLFILGCLILCVSFFYKNLKHLFFHDEGLKSNMRDPDSNKHRHTPDIF